MSYTTTLYRILAFCLAGVFAIFLVATPVFANTDAVSYLQSQSPSAWSTMALVAADESVDPSHLQDTSGTSAIEYTAPILALTAADKDPSSYPDTNLVDALLGYHSDDQIGDPTLVNDDIFAALALVSADLDPSHEVLADLEQFIKDAQNDDGGWGYTVSGSSDTNTTAGAIMALRALGIASTDSVIADAKQYLDSSQNDDGGFPYDPSVNDPESDASSDAWVISAIYALGEDPTNWEVNGNTPIDQLQSLQTSDGYFENTEDAGENSFTATTTSYALIALSGDTLPVATIIYDDGDTDTDNSTQNTTPDTADGIGYRIEGKDETICTGELDATDTALSLVEDAASRCGYTYTIESTDYGPYLTSIASESADGSNGWLYYVDMTAGTTSAADHTVEEGDRVLWQYGEFGIKPARLALSTTSAESGSDITVSVEYKENGVWDALSDATVYVDDAAYTTDSSGEVSITPDEGVYTVYAERDGYTRTSKKTLTVGNSSDTSVDLSVFVEESPQGAIAFSVDTSSIDFGTLSPGDTKTATAAIANEGEVAIAIESVVEGGGLFTNHLMLDSVGWNNFVTDLATSENTTVDVSLPIPNTYTSTGEQSGTLVFWATQQ